jgi:predicted P-loop ATPase
MPDTITFVEASIDAVRIATAQNEYKPLPIAGIHAQVKSPGKQPVEINWQQKFSRHFDEQSIREWLRKSPDCTNTGILTGLSGGVGAIDIDVRIAAAADEIRDFAIEVLGRTDCWREGEAPKILGLYRVVDKFRKVKTPTFIMPDGTEAAVEFLAEGQQVVAFGIHPKTRQPYRWLGPSPATKRAEELPIADLDAVEVVIEGAAQILREHGGVLKQQKKRNQERERPSGTGTIYKEPVIGDNFFFNVNNLAMANLGKWVPDLFHGKERFYPSQESYRVRSTDLNRDYEEDISFHPTGIYDFGPDHPLTPIDSVIEHGNPPDAKQAAFWLCEKIGVDPVTLGWVPPRAKASTERHHPTGEQHAEPTSDTSQPASDKKEEAADWRGMYLTTQKGNVSPCEANAALCLEHHPAVRDAFAFNEFAYRIEISRDLPWRKIRKNDDWTDADDIHCAIWLQRTEGIMVKPHTAGQAVMAVADGRKFNPVMNYLDALPEWDGTPRLEQGPVKYLGAEETTYHSEAFKRWMISGVARIYRPGCKADAMLVLEGDQDIGKSQFGEKLASPWSSDQIGDIGSKDSKLDTQGVWIMEFAELAQLLKAESSATKAFLTSPTDHFRPPYGRRTITVPRRCIFYGTINPEGGYLKDKTGNRRYWPIFCRKVDFDHIETDRDQLWAEAKHRFQAGEKWWFDTDALKNAAQNAASERLDEHPWTQEVLTYISHRDDGEPRKAVTVSEILRVVLNVPLDRQRQSDLNIISGILVAAGWRRRQVRVKRGRDGHWYSADGLEIDVLDYRTSNPRADEARPWFYLAPGNQG